MKVLAGRFENICQGLKELAQKYQGDVVLVYPVHRNPNVRQVVNSILGGIENVRLIDPLDYLPMVHLMQRSYLVLTDSGGLQEEAPSLGKTGIGNAEGNRTARRCGSGNSQGHRDGYRAYCQGDFKAVG